jgi:hypothetical protein
MLAKTFRADLQRAASRASSSSSAPAERQLIRVHDHRASFVTLALACGRSESWVADRTGHRSSAMIARYKRTARLLRTSCRMHACTRASDMSHLRALTLTVRLPAPP